MLKSNIRKVQMKYDVVIIAAIGGFKCAYMLSREGYNVCL